MSLIENLKGAIEVIQKSDNIDLIKNMMAIQNDAWELQEENRQLKEEIKSLNEKFNISGELKFENNTYWRVTDTDKDGPFCSGCWDDSKKLIRLFKEGKSSYSNCPKCKTRVFRVFREG